MQDVQRGNERFTVDLKLAFLIHNSGVRDPLEADFGGDAGVGEALVPEQLLALSFLFDFRDECDGARRGSVEDAARLQVACHAGGGDGEVDGAVGVADADPLGVQHRRHSGQLCCQDGSEVCCPVLWLAHVRAEERPVVVQWRLLRRMHDNEEVVHNARSVRHIHSDAAARQEAFWGHERRVIAVVGHKPVGVTCRTGGALQHGDRAIDGEADHD